MINSIINFYNNSELEKIFEKSIINFYPQNKHAINKSIYRFAFKYIGINTKFITFITVHSDNNKLCN